MHSEARKIHLIEEMLKVKSETVLIELELVLKKAGLYKEKKRTSAHEFAGTLSKEDAALMDAAIEEGCEQINPDDWK
ncbi:MAG TPA: hypothetical protein PLR74_15380 [Agriterribacter sp.]|nr:hypothetical protein [Agriterribacter sp.]